MTKLETELIEIIDEVLPLIVDATCPPGWEDTENCPDPSPTCTQCWLAWMKQIKEEPNV